MSRMLMAALIVTMISSRLIGQTTAPSSEIASAMLSST